LIGVQLAGEPSANFVEKFLLGLGLWHFDAFQVLFQPEFRGGHPCQAGVAHGALAKPGKADHGGPEVLAQRGQVGWTIKPAEGRHDLWRGFRLELQQRVLKPRPQIHHGPLPLLPRPKSEVTSRKSANKMQTVF
jgi:hypothetical protein